MESVALDEVDRGLIHGLTLDGRASFSRIAALLGVSDQTVARRYRRLRDAGVVRVLGRLDARRLGHVDWALRLQVTPGAAAVIARALAKRPDTSWVQLASGGTEVLCGTQASNEHDHEALLGQLTDTRQVLAMSAHCVLHTFRGGPAAWPGLTTALTPEQTVQLVPWQDAVPLTVELSDADRPLIDALGVDGRASHAALAQATGWHESTIRRRIDALRAAGALYIDVDVDERVFGIHANAVLWMTVAPAQLITIGAALASHRQIAFAAATTGASNLFASLMCRDVYALYEYLTNRIAAIPAITSIETVPIVRTIKRGSILAAQAVV